MKTETMSRVVALVSSLAAGALPAHLSAQGYPAKSVRIVVPFAAGGGTDIQARILGRHLEEQFGQRFLVDNRAGASGLIGADLVVVAAINGAVKKALGTQEVRAAFERDALVAVGGTPEELGAHLKSEISRYAEIIRKGNITLQ